MKKYKLIILLMSLLLLAGIAQITDAESQMAGILRLHIAKVKATNPSLYQKMVEKTKGNITSCMSCHGDIFKDQQPPFQPRPR